MTLVLGGIRSGKSQYAEQIAAGFGKKILYVATAEVWPGAGSMEYRVRKHRNAVLKAGSRWNVPVM